MTRKKKKSDERKHKSLPSRVKDIAVYGGRTREKKASAADSLRNGDTIRARLDGDMAKRGEKYVEKLRELPAPVIKGAGGEVALADPDVKDGLQQHFTCTLQQPDTVSAAASQSRMEQALELGEGCLSQALDAAETVGARNSLERMAAHQMATLHTMAMKAMSKGNDLLDGKDNYYQCDTVEASRMLRTAARLMSVYQEGLKTMAKLRTGGQQVVTVQHVNVSDGGQAVVAGQVRRGETDDGGKEKL